MLGLAFHKLFLMAANAVGWIEGSVLISAQVGLGLAGWGWGWGFPLLHKVRTLLGGYYHRHPLLEHLSVLHAQVRFTNQGD